MNADEKKNLVMMIVAALSIAYLIKNGFPPQKGNIDDFVVTANLIITKTQ